MIQLLSLEGGGGDVDIRKEEGQTSKLVMATLAKRKRTKASIMVFSSISKQSEHVRWQKNCFQSESEHVRQKENYFRSEANMFDRKTTVVKAKANMSDSKKIIFEAKRTH